MAIEEKVSLEERAKERLPEDVQQRVERMDERIAGWAAAHGPTILRTALGIVYVWFGALKVVDRSPVEQLVQDTVFFANGEWVVYAMGVWEIIIGLGLIVPVALRLTLLMLWAQLAGTMMAFVVVPGDCFQDGNPLLLTATGEFVLKNLVLAAAGIVIASTVSRGRRDRAAVAARSARAPVV